MTVIASGADVTVQSKQTTLRTRSIMLSSENATSMPEGKAFSTTQSLLDMAQSWWSEFKERDGEGGALKVKLRSLFRGSITPVFKRMFESPDDVLALTPPLSPNVGYSWLPTPHKRIETDERDLVFFESASRLSLRAANFAEAILQAWDSSITDEQLLLRMRRCLSSFVKTIMQTQVAVTFGCLQLRRDHYLHAAKGLSADAIQRLRHAPALSATTLFPRDLMATLNDVNYQSLQTKALLRISAASQRSNNDRQGRGGRRNVVRRDSDRPAAPRRDDGFRSNWYASKPGCSRSRLPLLTTSLPCSSSSNLGGPNHDVSRVTASSTPTDASYDAERRLLATLQTTPVGGRLRFHWREWRRIGASKRVCRWLRRGYRLPFLPNQEPAARSLFAVTCPPRLALFYNNPQKHAAILDLLQQLLDKHVIEQVPSHVACLHNIVFLRPKPNGTWRLILDVSALNRFLRVKSFKMDSAQVVRDALLPDTWATSVNWSDAYHHVPMHPNYVDFLAFQYAGTRYRYRCCPFGLSPLPQVFTEICLPLKAHVRDTWHVHVFQYLDDWLFASPSASLTATVTRWFVRLCVSLGLGVNLEKSCLSSSRRLIHLGVEWDFEKALARNPVPRTEEVRSLATRVAHASLAPLPTLESLLGKLVSLEKLVAYGRLHFRSFQRDVLAETRLGRCFRMVSLSASARADLRWWSDASRLQRWMPVRPTKPHLTVHTDASTLGWGACCDGRTVRGTWSPTERRFHINRLEMRAVRLALLHFAARFQGLSLLCRIDNLSTVYYINKQGGTRSPRLMAETEATLLLAESLQISLSASHIRGEHNVLADMLSRSRLVLKTEWRLSDQTFQWVCANSPFGRPTLELFANSLNHHLPLFVSPCVDAGSWAVDALVCTWPDWVLYAFPPTTILDRVLLKILQERPRRLLLVAPLRPLAPWFPQLRSLCMWVRRIPMPLLQLLQPHFQHQMPDPTPLSLALWAISCPDFATWATTTRLSTSSAVHV